MPDPPCLALPPQLEEVAHDLLWLTRRERVGLPFRSPGPCALVIVLIGAAQIFLRDPHRDGRFRREVTRNVKCRRQHGCRLDEVMDKAQPITFFGVHHPSAEREFGRA